MEILFFLGLVAAALAKPVLKRDPMINEGLFEGDILGIDPSDDRNAVPTDAQLWPGGVVPYVIAPDREDTRDLILKAMRHIEESSCIRFVPRTTQQDYIYIAKLLGCYAQWGRSGGAQHVSIGYGCENFAVVVHELMHAIGFEHEHNRSDRDDYLIINWENILEKWYYAFRKLRPDQNRLLTEFDFSSIMLYGSRAFAKNIDPSREDNYSMITKDGRFLEGIYGMESMSALDTKRLKLLYKCEEKNEVSA